MELANTAQPMDWPDESFFFSGIPRCCAADSIAEFSAEDFQVVFVGPRFTRIQVMGADHRVRSVL